MAKRLEKEGAAEIAKKVESILNNADYIDHFNIKIEGARAEVTSIIYTVKEYIVPAPEEEQE